MLKKILYSTHRVLGTVLSILFLMWFLSGFVMIYHTFPKVAHQDKYLHMDALSGNIQSPDSVLQQLFNNDTIFKLSLKSYQNKPHFEVLNTQGSFRISATDSIAIQNNNTPQFSDIKNYAQRWVDADIIQVDTLNQLEQWIPFSYLKKDFPIYKFYFGDKNQHQLYVSGVSGEALQFTNNNNRFWAWLGAIPHWIYFTSLRQDSQLWMNVVITLSALGCIMCIAGIIMGIRSYIIHYRRKNKWKSPYKKLSYKWHHILGFVFGIFVFTFCFSGMMSLADLPHWIVKVHNPSIQKSMMMPQPITIQNYKLDTRKIVEAYPQRVKSIEWASFGNLPLYKVVVDNRLITINASTDSVQTLQLNEEDIRRRISETHNEPIHISLLTEYDNYYVGLTDHLPLPIYKIEVEDADKSTYYIAPNTGNIRYFNTNDKVHRWLYQALHSYKTGFLSRHPVLWNILMWSTMLGGTLVSITGIYLSIKYIRRKIIKRKCNK